MGDIARSSISYAAHRHCQNVNTSRWRTRATWVVDSYIIVYPVTILDVYQNFSLSRLGEDSMELLSSEWCFTETLYHGTLLYYNADRSWDLDGRISCGISIATICDWSNNIKYYHRMKIHVMKSINIWYTLMYEKKSIKLLKSLKVITIQLYNPICTINVNSMIFRLVITRMVTGEIRDCWNG